MKRRRDNSADVARRLGTSEARYRTLVENPNLGVFLMDCQGNYLFVNSKIQEMTGYTPEDFVKNPRIGFTLTHPEDHSVGMRAFRNALLGRASQHNEFRLMHRNGESRWTASACYPVMGDDGRVNAVQVVIQDITDRKQAEAALARETRIREAEAAIRLRIARMQKNRDLIDVVSELSDQIGQLGVEHDACSIQIVNEDLSDFISCSKFHQRQHMIEQLDGLRTMAWTKRSTNMDVHPWVAQVFESGTSRYDSCTSEDAKLVAGISLIDVAFSHGTLAINRRQPEAFEDADIETLERLALVLSEGFHRFVDMMRHDQLEEQLRESQKMEALGQLVTGVSHNFNNMLMVILGNLSIVQRELPTSEFVDAAVDAGKRAAEIIEELMLYSRRGVSKKEPTDVQQLVRQAIAFCEGTDDGLRLELTLHGMLPTVYGHAGQLQQVVMNLCLNARDAIEAASVTEPRVEVLLDQLDVPSLPERLRQDSSTRHLRLRIRDNGIGMDEQTRTRIFDPFFTTKEIGQGTGLGLSTAYAIIDDHGGWIDVESQLGTGTQFSIYLPAGEETAPPSSGTDEVSGKFAAAGETILVVDDDPAVRRVLSISLNRAGYEVRECADGQSALDLVDRMSDRVSLVLLDISMPGMSGEQVLATLCARNPDLPIIILTGNNADSLHLDDAAAVVGKPISPENLLRVIGKTIAAKHMESQ